MAAPVILMMGAPGVGKSSQAKLLGARLGFAHISSGELLRSSAEPEVLAIMKRGDLVEPAVVEKALRDRLEGIPDGVTVVLDGFPREQVEADWLVGELARLGRRLEKIILLVVDPEEAKRRNLDRGRPDDAPESQQERWHEFNEVTLSMIRNYKNAGLVTEVNGCGTPEEVTARVVEALG